MSFWYTDPQDHTGAWYWVGIAISLAQSIGIHRDPHCINSIVPVQLHPLVRRIWWACVIRDRWLSLAKGRPMRVHDEDCDVFMPSAQDVVCEISNIKPEVRTKFVPAHSDTLAEIWVYFVKTSITLGQVLRMHYRVKGLKADTGDIEKVATDLDLHRQPELQPTITDELVLIHRYHWDIFYQ
jgi:Fungal specific transcription factor domain